jgi:hypothetical protein
VEIKEDYSSTPAWEKSSQDPISTNKPGIGGSVAQAVQHLLSLCEALSSKLIRPKKKKLVEHISRHIINKNSVLYLE